MRFQLSQVMDAIEQRLTTDVTGAQAVVDLGEVVRSVELDQGRPVSLVRIGMVIDALSRYLVDGGAMLYGVVERPLLSEQALTSKERMVLGRWADDGLIEVVPAVGDRVVEIADLTGLPLIARSPLRDQPKRYGWLTSEPGRVLGLAGRAGVAVLTPMVAEAAEPVSGPAGAATGQPVVGRAAVPRPRPPEASGPRDPEPAGAPVAEPAGAPVAEPAGAPVAEPAASAEPAGTAEPAGSTAPAVAAVAEPAGAAEPAGDRAPAADAEPVASGKGEPGEPGPAGSPGPGSPSPGPGSSGPGSSGPGSPGSTAEPGSAGPLAEQDAGTGDGAAGGEAAGPAEGTLPLPVEVFTRRGGTVARTRISQHRFLRAAPNQAYQGVLRRQWRCEEFECPVFGEHRRLGQPVPRMRGDAAVCPRHDQPVVDIGPRRPAYPVSIVVDDLPRRRLVVREGYPLLVGRGAADPQSPELVSVAPWLHEAAVAWISPVHLRLEAGEGGLVVTDLSQNGTVVWQRKGPDDPGTTRPLRRDSYSLGEWDSVELYTGIGLMRGDRRLAAVLGRDEPDSVLLDAPTAAHHQVGS